ncbi:hypothetical protein HDV04_001071 [Boothiomyces sp. JEL0838]|nr:hypothetical protein HDV04_001071 [Boothiomyces sp. JEL0838]
MATHSEDVIKVIIKEIVSSSTNILKTKYIEPSSETKAENQDNTNESNGVSAFFANGIQSAVKPYQVTDTLAAFMVRAVALDPSNHFNIAEDLPKEEVDRLINKITATNDPEMETIRVQVYFDTHFSAQDYFLQLEKATRNEQCSTLLREITDSRQKTIPAFEILNRKIVSYVLLKSNIGVPTDMRVIREATAALESVFPNSELSTFVSLPRLEKEQQLLGLTNLVTGIRLFNKNLEKGGETIENLPEICTTEWRELSMLVRSQMQDCEYKIQLYKAALDYALKTPNSEVSDELNQLLNYGLVFNRQYLIYLDALQEQVDSSQQILQKLSNGFEQTLKDLKFACRSKTAVPVDQVYPLFISLSTYWSGWYDQIFYTSFRRGILNTLMHSAAAFEIQVPDIVVTLSEPFMTDIEPEILDEHEVIQKATETMTALGMITKNVEVVHPGNSTMYYQLPVEFGGFCPFALVSRDGLVVPGDKNIGMVRYKDRLLAFENITAAVEFFKQPDQYVDDIIQLSKLRPPFVQLLHLYKFFPTVDTLERAQSYSRQRLLGQLPIVAEAGCQVDTHIVDSYIKPNYKWNEWDMRREALMLANLKDKRTHSCQTDNSHFRRDSETQHYAQKDNYVQTTKSSSTSVPKTKHYLAGLRNNALPFKRNMYQAPLLDRKHHFKVIDLSIDVEGGPVPYGGGAYGLPPLIKTPKKSSLK